MGGNAFKRQQVVHDGEHTLFHFAAVPGAADQLHTLGQVECHEVFRVHSLLLPVRVGALGAVHHHEIRLKALQFFIARADKHVFDEMRLPGHFCDKADFQAGICVSTAEGIDHEQALAGKLLGDQFFSNLPRLQG
ncbi:Uncharacterised protein [Serratia fonticola]|uniref:Uncharacterized protein n=1 Tax=Serratia fonticola TaxID=47917 RepID=A0A4V6KXC8_SERFO|nr:Uncharacterised protein [Serratia fonticola]